MKNLKIDSDLRKTLEQLRDSVGELDMDFGMADIKNVRGGGCGGYCTHTCALYCRKWACQTKDNCWIY